MIIKQKVRNICVIAITITMSFAVAQNSKTVFAAPADSGLFSNSFASTSTLSNISFFFLIPALFDCANIQLILDLP